MRLGSYLTAIILLGFLTGCAGGPQALLAGSAPRTISLSPEAPEGIVILGLPRPGIADRLFQGGRHVHTLEFHAYDPAKNLLIAKDKEGADFALTQGGTLVDTVDEIGGVQYMVQRLPAGHYYLTAVRWGEYGQTLMRDGSIAIEIVPGTAIYYGNLDFDTAIFVFLDVPLRAIERDDAAARSVLAQYSDVHSGLQNRALSVFKLNCDLGEGIETCYAH